MKKNKQKTNKQNKKNQLILGLVLVRFDHKLVLKFFLCGFYLYLMLYIVKSYQSMQFQEQKLVNQTWEKDKKPSFGCLYALVMSRTGFRVNPHSIVAWMSRNALLEAGVTPEV